jgi:hypothetical protein
VRIVTVHGELVQEAKKKKRQEDLEGSGGDLMGRK